MKYTPSATDSVGTPDEIIEFLKKKYDNWYDPCPLNKNPTVNGLQMDWLKECKKQNTTVVYVNPPYSRQKPWLEKAAKYNNLTIVFLIKNESLGSRYFSRLNPRADIIFITPHVRFKGYSSPARFSSLLLVMHPKATNSFHFWEYA